MLVVADSSALIALAVCDGLDVILQVYDDLKIPEAAYTEIVAPEKPHSDALGGFLAERVVTVDASRWVVTAGGLGRGEIEAMALYKQLSADALLIYDHRARVIAEHNQIECIGRLVCFWLQSGAEKSACLRRTLANSANHPYSMETLYSTKC